MRLSEIYGVVDSYYQFRGLTYPDLFDAAYWLVTEVGELQNALTRLESGWVRNNSEDKPLERVADELGDVLMMFAVVAHLAGVDEEIAYQPFTLEHPSDLKYELCYLGYEVNHLALEACSNTLEDYNFFFVLKYVYKLGGYLDLNPYQAMLRKFHKKVRAEHSKIAGDFANWEQYRLYLETLIKNEPA